MFLNKSNNHHVMYDNKYNNMPGEAEQARNSCAHINTCKVLSLHPDIDRFTGTGTLTKKWQSGILIGKRFL
jgi:hypothetical protein